MPALSGFDLEERIYRLHLLWQACSDIGEALVYLGVAAILLGWRLRRRHLRQGKAAAVGAQ